MRSKGQDDWDKNTNTFLVDISAASRSIWVKTKNYYRHISLPVATCISMAEVRNLWDCWLSVRCMP